MKRLVVLLMAGLLLIGVTGAVFAEAAGNTKKPFRHIGQRCRYRYQRQNKHNCVTNSQCGWNSIRKGNNRYTCRKPSFFSTKHRGRYGKAAAMPMLRQHGIRSGIMAHMKGHFKNNKVYTPEQQQKFKQKMEQRRNREDAEKGPSIKTEKPADQP